MYGIDIGRGWAKAISNYKQIKFPSYVTEGRTLDLETEQNNQLDNLKVSINGKEWFIGELARKEGGSREFQKEKAGHRNTIPLLITAIALTSYKDYLKPKVVIGVPVSDYRTQGKAFEKEVCGFYRVKLPGKKVEMEIIEDNVLSFPEGAGALWTQNIKEKRAACIDIGWKTVNFVVMDNLQYQDGISGTILMGLSKAFKMYYKRVSRQQDILPSEAEKRLTDEGQDELRGLAQEITDQVNMWWSGNQFDVVFIAGGGGKALFDYMDFENMKLIGDAQMANARGYFQVAKMKLRR